MDAVARQDIRNTILVLAYCRQEHINTPYSKTDTRTALHIAAALGNLVLVQLLLWVCTLHTSLACFVLMFSINTNYYPAGSWWRGTVVEHRSLAGELSLSCARPAADG